MLSTYHEDDGPPLRLWRGQRSNPALEMTAMLPDLLPQVSAEDVEYFRRFYGVVMEQEMAHRGKEA